MKNLCYLLMMIVLWSCSKNEDETTCLPLPNNKDIIIVDKITGQNVFTSGMFTQNQMQIVTNPTDQFPLNFTQNAGPNTLTIFPIKTAGIIDFSIVLNNEITIPLKGKIIINNACGTNYYFESITTEDTNFVVEENGTNLKIKI